MKFVDSFVWQTTKRRAVLNICPLRKCNAEPGNEAPAEAWPSILHINQTEQFHCCASLSAVLTETQRASSCKVTAILPTWQESIHFSYKAAGAFFLTSQRWESCWDLLIVESVPERTLGQSHSQCSCLPSCVFMQTQVGSTCAPLAFCLEKGTKSNFGLYSWLQNLF